MRPLLFGFSLLVATMPLARNAAQAEEEVTRPAERSAPAGQIVSLELIDAHREYQLAKLRMHEHRFVTLPQQRRQLDNQVALAEREIAVLHRRLRDYRPFLQVGRYSPVRSAAESHHLALVAAEQRLQYLKDERIALLRLSRQNAQLYQLDVLRAATQMALAKDALGSDNGAP